MISIEKGEKSRIIGIKVLVELKNRHANYVTDKNSG